MTPSPPAAGPTPAPPGFWGTFADPALERRYRTAHVPDDLAAFRLAAGLTAGGVLLFVVNDLRQPAALPVLLGLRAAFLLATAAVYRRVRRPVGPGRLAGLVLGWSLVYVAFNLGLQLLRPPGHFGHAGATVCAIVLGYALTPLPPRWLFGMGVAHSAGCVLVAGWANPAADPGFVPTLAAGLAAANVLGAATARLLHARGREVFLAMARQAELTAALERSLAEVRTLRGLIRICAWCKGIHADGEWQRLERYVAANSHAEFTHGICPSCLAVQTGGAGGTLDDASGQTVSRVQ